MLTPPTPKSTPTDKKECKQDVFERLNRWIDALEERACALLEASDPESMEPAQCAHAAIQLFQLLPRLLQLRQEYAINKEAERVQRLLERRRRAEMQRSGLLPSTEEEGEY